MFRWLWSPRRSGNLSASCGETNSASINEICDEDSLPQRVRFGTASRRNPDMCRDIFAEKERIPSVLFRYGHGEERRARLSQITSEEPSTDIEALGEDGRRHVLFREALHVFDGYQLRQTVPISDREAKNASCYQTTNHRRFDAQHGGRLPKVEEAFGRHVNVWHRPILSQIFREEQVTSDPPEPIGVPGRRKTSINDGPNNGGKPRIASEVILYGMVQGYEPCRLGIRLHWHGVLFKRVFYFQDIFARKKRNSRSESPARDLAHSGWLQLRRPGLSW